MAAPTTVLLRVACTDLAVFSALADPAVHVIVRDVPISTPHNDDSDPEGIEEVSAEGTAPSEVARTCVKTGTSCDWGDEPIPIDIYLDARRGYTITIHEGPDALCQATVPMRDFFLESVIETDLYCTEVQGKRKGTLTVQVEEKKEASGELWLSGVGLQGQGAYHDPHTTYLSVRRGGVQIARSPESWESMCGPLEKFSTGKKTSLFKNWKNRWCVGNRAGLTYYEHADAKSKGCVNFDTTCVSPPFAVVREPNPTTHSEVKDPSLSYFAVRCVDSGKPLTLLFKAADADTHTKWCDFLERQMDFAEGAPSTWPVARIPASVLRDTQAPLEVAVVLKEDAVGIASKRQGSQPETIISSGAATAADLLESKKVLLGPAGSDGCVAFSRVRRKRAGLRDALRSGLSLNIAFSLDFTAGNGDPKLASSLHTTDPNTPNDYLRVVHQALAALRPFSSSTISAYGFGGSLEVGGFSSRFPLDRDGMRVRFANYGEIEDAYTGALQSVQLLDPRNFAPSTRAVVEEVRMGDQAYTVMFIVACGDPRDSQEFMDVVASSSGLPVTIVVVGVGNGSFEKMRLLQQSVHSTPVTSPITRVPGCRPNFRFVRCAPKDFPMALAAVSPTHCTHTVNNPASPATYDMASALSALPYHILDWARVSGKKLDE
eukprot:TRINITY_DN20698_c0_g1_i1.p1 TRINITY_DN20698_c0_g1~~TRINITY_DN20698_c0_g1_i1.p1  ORF type:complete len:659 (+),score=232.43 TRINITY_DN20698_c0_g1_i1:266-2242(+)